MPAQPRVLLTRPAAQSDRFAADLRARLPGADITISPLLAPEYLRPALPEGPHAAVIFTSETGVAAAKGLDGLPNLAWCVGERTAAAAQAAGFRTVTGGGDAALLVQAMIQAMRDAPPPAGRLIHLRGREARGDVAQRLWDAGLPCDEAVVYAQQAQPLSPRAQMLLEDSLPIIVPLFSPRSALVFAKRARGARAPLWIAALSPAVAKACPPAARTEIAARTDAAAMCDAVERLATRRVDPGVRHPPA